MEEVEVQKHIDNLLVKMNDEIESGGHAIGNVMFDFSDNGKDMNAFIESSKITLSEARKIYNICMSRKYLKRIYMSGHKGIVLSENGQGRAISVKNATTNEPQLGNGLNIGALTIQNGNVQIGNHNIQQVEQVFDGLIKSINDSQYDETEKFAAKNKLKEFLEMPLIHTVLGGLATHFIGLL